MVKIRVLGLSLALNACGQANGPSVPEPLNLGPLKGVTADAQDSGASSDSVASEKESLPASRDTTPVESEPEAIPSRTIKVSLDISQGVWEGWGTSLGWWANGVGNSNYEDMYADLFFSDAAVKFLGDTTIPGLKLGLVRYNVGGAGRPNDISDQIETPDKAPSSATAHDGFEPYRRIEGFWKDNVSADPRSTSFAWNRDSGQRSMLTLAKRRGVVNFELYANAPMWWMTAEKSASGGKLLDDQKSNSMLYLALVAKQARTAWNIPIGSVEPFNEPSSGKWVFPTFQQGYNLSLEAQVESLAYLKLHLTDQGVGDAKIAAADERNPTDALANNTYMESRTATYEGLTIRASSLYDKVNVHTADNAVPFQNNDERDKLRAGLGTKKIWVTDYNDTDATGSTLAQSILDDLNHLKPTAWVYFQAAEPYSNRGLVTGDYTLMPNDKAVRGKPIAVATKYYVMAQFSRFIMTGHTLLGRNEEQTIAGFNAATKKLDYVTVNKSEENQTLEIDLSSFKSWNASVTVATTRFDGSKLFQVKQLKTNGTKVIFTAEAGSVTSLELTEVTLP